MSEVSNLNKIADLEGRVIVLRGLLRRLIDHEGMIVFAAPNCSCEDCELVLEIKKELKDAKPD